MRHMKWKWITVRKTRDIYIRRRRVLLSEVYSSISENFHLVHTNGTGQSCVEVNASVQYDWSRTITVLPDPVTWRADRLSSKMALAPRLQMRGLETLWLSTTRRNGRGPDSSLKRFSIFVWTRVYTSWSYHGHVEWRFGFTPVRTSTGYRF